MHHAPACQRLYGVQTACERGAVYVYIWGERGFGRQHLTVKVSDLHLHGLRQRYLLMPDRLQLCAKRFGVGGRFVHDH